MRSARYDPKVDFSHSIYVDLGFLASVYGYAA